MVRFGRHLRGTIASGGSTLKVFVKNKSLGSHPDFLVSSNWRECNPQQCVQKLACAKHIC